MGSNDPLGMPPGSVRAIIALFVIVAVIGSYIASWFTGINGVFPAEILALPSFIIGYYFGTRQVATGSP